MLLTIKINCLWNGQLDIICPFTSLVTQSEGHICSVWSPQQLLIIWAIIKTFIMCSNKQLFNKSTNKPLSSLLLDLAWNYCKLSHGAHFKQIFHTGAPTMCGFSNRSTVNAVQRLYRSHSHVFIHLYVLYINLRFNKVTPDQMLEVPPVLLRQQKQSPMPRTTAMIIKTIAPIPI